MLWEDGVVGGSLACAGDTVIEQPWDRGERLGLLLRLNVSSLLFYIVIWG